MPGARTVSFHIISEILTSGVEKLFTEAYDFSVKDPEYLKLILRFLDGRL